MNPEALSSLFPDGFPGEIRLNEPMSLHTAFRVGGPADFWIRPEGDAFPAACAALLRFADKEKIPVFILGGGANIVVSDRGIRGFVLDTGGWTGLEPAPDGESVLVRSGAAGDLLADALAAENLGGLEFLAGMPGSIGGMVWMNARAMEKQVSDALLETEIIDENRETVTVPVRAGDFGYKKSPFQGRDCVILRARFALRRREGMEILRETAEYRKIREERGHFRAPSAGSVFKNSREAGRPAGKIIEELGLRGLSVGGAQVAPWHGNFIINTGGAKAAEIRELAGIVANTAREKLGIVLEPEILFTGEW